MYLPRLDTCWISHSTWTQSDSVHVNPPPALLDSSTIGVACIHLLREIASDNKSPFLSAMPLKWIAASRAFETVHQRWNFGFEGEAYRYVPFHRRWVSCLAVGLRRDG